MIKKELKLKHTIIVYSTNNLAIYPLIFEEQSLNMFHFI